MQDQFEQGKQYLNARISRRTFVKTVTAFTGCLLFSPLSILQAVPGPFPQEIMEKRKVLLNSFRETIKNFQSQSRLPIIDVELHWGNIELKELIEKMDRNGVALTWLGPVERKGNKASIIANQQYPGRIVPTIMHGDQERWHGKDLSLVREIAEDANSGEYFAMGEFEARHYVSSTNNRNIHMPMDSDSFHGIFKASEDTGLPFLVHHEAEDVLLPEMERMLKQYPLSKVVWCHIGRTANTKTWTVLPEPVNVRKLLSTYPNLFFDILVSGPMSAHAATGVRQAILYEVNDGPPRLKTEWISLFNDFSDRFLIGTDVNSGRFDGYDQVISRMRMLVLRPLEPQAAEKIAFKNAWKMMSGEEWT